MTPRRDKSPGSPKLPKNVLKKLAVGVVEGVAQRAGAVRLTGLRGASHSVVAAELVRAHEGAPVLILGPSAKSCDLLMENLRTALGERDDARRVWSLPRHDTLPYDRFSPQPFVVAERMNILYRWLALSAAGPGPRSADPGAFADQDTEATAPVVVSDWTALAVRVPAREVLRRRSTQIRVGETRERDDFVARLVEAGYSRMSLVEEPGEIAVRGGIVDFFPPQRRHPLRIEFFGDEVDSIRDFDPSSQRSQAKLAVAVAPPPRELLFDRDLVIERGEAIRELAEAQSVPKSEVDSLIDSLLRGHVPPGAEAIAPCLQPAQERVLDYLPANTLIILDDPEAGRARLDHYYDEAVHNHATARESERVVAPVEELLVAPREISSELEERLYVSLERLDLLDAESAKTTEKFRIETTSHDALRRNLADMRTHEHALTPLADQLADWTQQRWRVVLTLTSLSAAERLKELLTGYGIETNTMTDPRPCWHWSRPGRVEIRVAPFSEGFSLEMERLAVVTEEEIFGKREKRRKRSAWQVGAAVDGLSQLAPGDHLVHTDHGIGIYRGLRELRAGRVESELLCLEYAGGDKLFLPVHRLNLVHRYGAFEGPAPRLDRLGGETWEKAKTKVKKSLRNMASELLSMHAARELASGFAFSPRDSYFEEFEAAFDYEETPDQLAAINEVLSDMQNPKPMDRLVCGDVGYGKTEVAIRAAFRAAMDGKQVAVLVPTTILCQQHFETFEKRFAGYPIRVEMLSRFRSPKESRLAVEGLATGSVDIIVGTHRLLQKNIAFRDLGLLVVDEEQRFGVAHKERIKRLKRSVDVVTLTATPIPRTLQMSFTGLRDLSVIDTPPADRLAVRTQICRFSESLIRESILRELRRGGQIFFVHNRVKTIGNISEMLARVVPEARVVIAHGQMREHQLEDRMHAFMRGEHDVLLCTTIIESGLDIPRTNTILINRADALGLAQMYQLRGRVGRSSHRAYAYFLIPAAMGNLTGDSRRRLEAIQDLTELGSGFRLANMDLEIRGAGDLLGSEQSGNLRAVGYETYMEMLEETVEELRGTVHEQLIDPEIRLPVLAHLPDDFVPEVSQRLVQYKRLSSAHDENEVNLIRDEILDRYGPLPSEAENLLQVIRLKILARRIGISIIGIARGEIVLTVAEKSQIDAKRLLQLLTRAASGMRVTPDHKIYCRAPGPEGGPPALFDAVRSLLKRLASS